MAYEHAAAINAWIKTNAPRDGISKLVKRLVQDHGAQTGTTPANNVAIYDKWQKHRLGIFKQVVTVAGLVKADLSTPATADAKIDAAIAGMTAANQRIALRKIGVFYDVLRERLDDAIDIDPDATQDIGSKPVYGPSIASTNGWTELTDTASPGDVLEAIIRGDP